MLPIAYFCFMETKQIRYDIYLNHLTLNVHSQTPITGISTKTKGKYKRQRDDALTKLNQEQTALLIYCLQKARIILKDEYLSNKEAGQAFAMLTGYSADTLRQSLGKADLSRIITKKNVKALHDTLTNLTILIGNDMKPEK